MFDSTTGQVYREFMAFSSAFTGGVYVTAGDVDHDGRDDIAVSTGARGGLLTLCRLLIAGAAGILLELAHRLWGG